MGKGNDRNRTRGGMSRRHFIRNTSATAVAAGTTPVWLSGCGDDGNGMMNGDAGSGGDAGRTQELSILQWQHFVPKYDTWFDPFARMWGENNGVDVKVDHVPLGDLTATFQSELDAGEGHDLVEFIAAPPQFEKQVDVEALKDVNMMAQQMFGDQLDICRKSSFNPTTGNWYGFAHGWVADPGNYLKSLWQGVGFENGPRSWQDLLDGGGMVLDSDGVPIGLGLSNELDSNMATRALLWSFGASIQDENGNIAIDSQETRDAINFMQMLVNNAMDPGSVNIYNWQPASNNRQFVEGRVSYIVNSLSAFRTAQEENSGVANDTFFTPALKGPDGMGFGGPHVLYVYVIPQHARNKEAAKDFLLALTEKYDDAVFNSKLYNFAAFPQTAPSTNMWLDEDPHGSQPATKLQPLKNASEWTVNQGYPGTSNAAAVEIFNTSVVPEMFRKIIRDGMGMDAAIMEAKDKMSNIFDKWSNEGLV